MKFITERQFFLLRVLNSVPEVDGNTKLVKLAFIAQTLEKIGAYKFIRWHYGPYSPEIPEDLNYLLSLGVITSSDGWFGSKKYKLNYEAANRLGIHLSKVDALEKVGPAILSKNLKSFLADLYESVEVDSFESGSVIDTESPKVQTGIQNLIKKII